MSKKIILDNKYELGGGMGSWAKSYEYDVKLGDVRVIGGKLMYAYSIYNRYFVFIILTPKINWCPVDETLKFDVDMKKWIASL